METDEFQENLEELITFATKEQVVIRCAEAAYLRCHRRLIADALLARGLRVEHITSPTSSIPHKLPAWARVQGTKVSYPTVSA